MEWTTIKMSELMRQKTRRMDAGYWIKKKAPSGKQQAASVKLPPQLNDIKNYES